MELAAPASDPPSDIKKFLVAKLIKNHIEYAALIGIDL